MHPEEIGGASKPSKPGDDLRNTFETGGTLQPAASLILYFGFELMAENPGVRTAIMLSLGLIWWLWDTVQVVFRETEEERCRKMHCDYDQAELMVIATLFDLIW